MRYSVAELLSWMREQPRTINWNAMVAYDRGKTNTVLLQEYIASFTSGSYFPPFSGSIPSTESEVEWVYDYLVDSPRLSFENARITSSRADLTMKILGGAQVTIATEAGGSAAVIRVAEYDALQGPKLTMAIDLRATTGTVDSVGTVELDLGAGREPLLYHAPTQRQRERGGAFMLNRIQQLGPDIRVFVLNEIGAQTDQFLRPEKFELRTHAEPGANNARAANAGEGAVLLFITMQGGDNGTIPVADEDLKFLIPAGAYSAAALLGNRFMLDRILSEGLRRVVKDPGDFRWELTGPDLGFADGVRVIRGEYKVANVSTTLPSFSNIAVSDLVLPMEGHYELIKNRGIDELRVHWTFGGFEFPCLVTPRGSTSITGTVSASWRYEQAFVFEIEGDQSELRLIEVQGGRAEQIKVSPGTFADEESVRGHFAELESYLVEHLSDSLETGMNTFARVAEEIDIFRLNSLLFKGANIVRFKNANLPGDLALFGELASDQTHFIVDPLEPLLGHGVTRLFKTVPEVAGLVWTVAHIEGGSGYPGKIEQNGLYTAPLASEIEGFFIRIRVTASKGAYYSSALVTVLVRDILVSPFIQICGASTAGQAPLTREVAAGSLTPGAPTWSVTSDIGSRVRPSFDPQGDHTFEAGNRVAGTMFSVDEVIARDRDGRTGSSWVLVVHGMPNASIVEDGQTGLPEGEVQLLMDLGAEEGPIPPESGPEYGLKWAVLKGGGHIDEDTGRYSVDPASSFRFALITATIPPPRPIYPSFNAFIILPLPLIDLPTLRTALDTSQRYFEAARSLGIDEAAKLLEAGPGAQS